MKKSFSLILAVLLVIAFSISAYCVNIDDDYPLCNYHLRDTTDNKTYSGLFTNTQTSLLKFSIDVFDKESNTIIIKNVSKNLSSFNKITNPDNQYPPEGTIKYVYEIIENEFENDYVDAYINDVQQNMEDDKIYYLTASDVIEITSFPLEINRNNLSEDSNQIYIYLVIEENSEYFIMGYGLASITDLEEYVEEPEEKTENDTVEVKISGKEQTGDNEERNPNTGAEKIVIIIGAVSLVALIVAIILMKKLK